MAGSDRDRAEVDGSIVRTRRTRAPIRGRRADALRARHRHTTDRGNSRDGDDQYPLHRSIYRVVVDAPPGAVALFVVEPEAPAPTLPVVLAPPDVPAPTPMPVDVPAPAPGVFVVPGTPVPIPVLPPTLPPVVTPVD